MLIKEGVFLGSSKTELVFVFLFDDIIAEGKSIAEKKGAKRPSSSTDENCVLQKYFSLSAIEYVDVPDSKKEKNVWQITLSDAESKGDSDGEDASHTIRIVSESPEQKAMWKETILRQIAIIKCKDDEPRSGGSAIFSWSASHLTRAVPSSSTEDDSTDDSQSLKKTKKKKGRSIRREKKEEPSEDDEPPSSETEKTKEKEEPEKKPKEDGKGSQKKRDRIVK